MTDQFGRKIKYLRLSVTDLCSCRCVYCMGAEGVPKLPHEAVLSFEEIEEIVRAAVSLGVRKVRLTGGEPLVRRGIDELVRRLRAIEGIRRACDDDERGTAGRVRRAPEKRRSRPAERQP